MEIDPKAVAIVDSTENLPTLPDIIVRITELIDDPDSSADDLNEMISADIALASKILKIVNSSFYGFSRNISSVTHAVVILGFNTVRNIALSAFIFDNMTSQALKPLWEHSIAVGAVTKLLAAQTGIPQQEEAFISGLLHDIGRVVLFVNDSDRMLDLVDDCLDESLYEAEKQEFGIYQQEIGAALLDKWKLPDALIESIKYSRHPLEADLSLAAIVYVANGAVKSMKVGNSFDGNQSPLTKDILAKAELSIDQIKALKPQIEEAIKNAAVFKSMI